MTDKDFPAFPRQHDKEGHNGMTLRDYFAAAALANPYSHDPSNPDFIAEWAYQVADAMLEARTA